MTIPVDFDETTRLREENKELREHLYRVTAGLQIACANLNWGVSGEMVGRLYEMRARAEIYLGQTTAALTENGQGTLPPVSLTRP